jgi:DNA repair protein RecO (recombination protein O)
MIISTEGIVLRQRKIAGNRRMIVIFTRQYGKISAGTSINEKSRSKSALALRPFTFAEYELFKGRDSYSINSASARRSYYSIGEDLDRFMIASAFIEYLDKVTGDDEPMPGLYDLALEFLESIAVSGKSSETLLFAFIVKSLRLLGVSPELKSCVSCGRSHTEIPLRNFSVTDGGMLCDECADMVKSESNALIYRPRFDIIDVFRYFQSKPLQTFEKVVLKNEVAGMIKRILAEYTGRYLDADVLSRTAEPEA